MRILAVVLLLVVISACDDNRLSEQNIDIDNKAWVADTTYSFQFNVPDIRERYRLYMNVRNTLSYPYENLYINYQLTDTLNNIIKKELVNYNLFDPRTGRPYGEGLGDVFDHQFLLIDNFKFDRTGPFRLNMQHYMRMDTLPEILSVGYRVEYASVED